MQHAVQMHAGSGRDSKEGTVLQKDTCFNESQLPAVKVTCQADGFLACSPEPMNERSLQEELPEVLHRVTEAEDASGRTVFFRGSTPYTAHLPTCTQFESNKSSTSA